jgi:tRNA A37 threonylcarbamoyladenosine modification protein TsaB
LLWFESSFNCNKFFRNDDRAFLGKNYDVIIPLIDARRMEVYCAVFDGNSGEMITKQKRKF